MAFATVVSAVAWRTRQGFTLFHLEPTTPNGKTICGKVIPTDTITMHKHNVDDLCVFCALAFLAPLPPA